MARVKQTVRRSRAPSLLMQIASSRKTSSASSPSTMSKDEKIDWNTRKCPELRAELKDRLLLTTGVKRELVSRLRSSDRLRKGLSRGDLLWWRHQTRTQLLHECKILGLSEKGYNKVLYHRLEVSDRLRREAEQDIIPIHFPQFSRLPPELRLMIWKLTLPGPRAIAVDVDITNGLLFSPIDHRCANPVALSVCSESRELALKSYSRFLGWNEVYADFELGDYLYFGDWCDANKKDRTTDGVVGKLKLRALGPHSANSQDVEKVLQLSQFGPVKHIAVTVNAFKRFSLHGRGKKSIRANLSVFENLQEVACVLRETTTDVIGHEVAPEFSMRDCEKEKERGIELVDLIDLIMTSHFKVGDELLGGQKQIPKTRFVVVDSRRRL